MTDRNDENLPARKGDSGLSGAALSGLQGLQDVDVKITVEWGRSEITVAEAINLSAKSLLRTDKQANDPVDILVNGKLFGRGELVLVGKDTYGVRLDEIIDAS